MYRNLLLDATGTLIEPAESVGTVYSRHFGEFGVTMSAEDVENTFRPALEGASIPDYASFDSGEDAERAWWMDLVRRILRSGHETAGRLADSSRFEACFEGLFAHYADPGAWEVFPEVVPFLRSASRHARLAIVSNFDARLVPILEGLGILRYFDHVVTSGQARSGKPDPAIFRRALRLLGARPEEAAHAGDSLIADVAGAKAAGIAAFHLTRPTRSLLDFLEFCEIPAS